MDPNEDISIGKFTDITQLGLLNKNPTLLLRYQCFIYLIHTLLPKIIRDFYGNDLTGLGFPQGRDTFNTVAEAAV